MLKKRLHQYIVLFICSIFLFAGVGAVCAELTPLDCPHCVQQSLPKCCQQDSTHTGDNHAESAQCKHGSLCIVNVGEVSNNIAVNSKLPITDHNLEVVFLSLPTPTKTESYGFVSLPNLVIQEIHLKNCIFLI